MVRIATNGILLPMFKGRTIDFKSIPRIRTSTTTLPAEVDNQKINKIDFKMNTNVSLKDILKTTSTNRGGVK